MGCVLLRSAEAMICISFSSDTPCCVRQDCTSNVPLVSVARLVEDYRIDFGNGIQVITAFEQYTQAGCGADTAEVSQRNADYQSART